MKKKFMYTILVFTVFFLTDFSMQKQPTEEKSKINLKSEQGLHIVTFETPQGKINVNLPDDTARGDTISGTVVAHPAGKTENELAENRDVLNGYVVEINEQQTPAIEKRGKWIILAVNLLPVILRDANGEEVGKAEVPVLPELPESIDFRLPKIGQTGHPIAIRGNFDGDFSNTEVHLGDKDVPFLAESPRQAIFESPHDIVGPTLIRLQEEDFKTESEFRNVKVSLSAPKLILRKGEKTELTVTVEGLEGLDSEIPLQIINKTPSVVNVESEGTIAIAPPYVEEGVFTHTCHISGITSGAFIVSAQILLPYIHLPLEGISLDILNLYLPKKPPSKIRLKDIENAVDMLEDWNSDKKDGERWMWKLADQATERRLSRLSQWDKTTSGSLTGVTPWMLKALRSLALSKTGNEFNNHKDDIKYAFDNNPHTRGNLKDNIINSWKAQDFRKDPLNPASHSRAKTIGKFKNWINSLARKAKAGGIGSRSSIMDRIQKRFEKVKGKRKQVEKTHKMVADLVKKMKGKIKTAKDKDKEVGLLKQNVAKKAKEVKEYERAKLHKEAKNLRKEEKEMRENMRKKAEEAKRFRTSIYKELSSSMKKLKGRIDSINRIESFIKSGK